MKFEKISPIQWRKDCIWHIADELKDVAYKHLKLPVRSTKYSAGYDFFSPMTVQLKPNSELIIPTGIRWNTDIKNKDKILMIVPRSGLGFKHGIRLANTVAIIDADYCDSDNEGHILLKLINKSDNIVTIPKGKAFAQGIITKYELTEDDEADGTRNGGFGSTDK